MAENSGGRFTSVRSSAVDRVRVAAATRATAMTTAVTNAEPASTRVEPTTPLMRSSTVWPDTSEYPKSPENRPANCCRYCTTSGWSYPYWLFMVSIAAWSTAESDVRKMVTGSLGRSCTARNTSV